MKRAAFTFLLFMALVPCVATAAPNPRDFFANTRDSEFASAVSNGDREKLERLVGNEDVISQAALLLRYDLVYLMLQAGADPTARNKYGFSSVRDIQRSSHNMLRSGPLWPWREKVVALLKARGIDIDRVEVNRGLHPSGPLPTSDEVSKKFEGLYSDTHVTHVELLAPDPRITKQVTFRVHFRAPPDPVEWWVDWRYWDKGDGTYR